ncbi:MAG: hypothetical protein LUQ59_07100, partial [Methanothrix sp.]|nr:hypothetical protein [Methanothrix sp.]
LVITDEPSHQKGDGYRNSTYTVEGANKNLSTSGVILIAVSPDFGNPSVDPGVPRSDLTKYVDMRVIANEIGLWIDINSADFSTILDQFKGILTGTYVIEYTSPDQMPGKNRTALVSVDAPGCVAGSDSSAYVSSGSKDNLNSPPAIESMTSDKASPQDAGTAINWTANAVDPDDDLILYKFLLDGRPMTPWAEDKTWIWMPGQAGHYRVEVQVRDAKHAGPNAQDDRMEESFTINERKPATSENQPPIVNDLLAMQSKAKEITWTANATDSDGDRILYRYFLNNKSMTDWIDRNKWILNATEANAGENQVEVQIRDGVHADPNGYDDAKSVKFNLSSMKLMTQTWEKKLAGSGASVKQTEDGGYIVAGGGDGGWLIKTDSYGNTLWEVNYGGGQCEHVEQTNDGGYIVAGLNVSSDGKDTDVWLIKTDKNGNLIWDNTFGGSQTEYGLFVQQTNDGGYLIAGECTSYSGDFDAWVIKTDSEGNAEWDKTYGKTSAKSALQTDDGEYIIIGYTIYSDPDNAWIIKANLKGEEQWHRELSGDTVQSGTKTNDDGYIVAGGFYSDAWLTKTDENGNEKWHKTLSRTTAHFAQQTKDGGYIVAGGDYPSSAWLIKTDANGNEEWQRTLDEVHKTHGANSVAQTKDGGYIVVAEGWLFKTDANGNV